MTARRARKPAIPLTLVNGPLGSGKTILINRLLDHPSFANTAVILNEFGRTKLLSDPAETAEDGVIALGSGCVCCTVRGELVSALERLLRGLDNGRIGAIERVIIEAEQNADPAAVLAGVLRHPYLSMRFRADGIVSVLPATGIERRLAGDEVAVRQVAMADLIVLTGSADGDDAADGRLHTLNPLASLTRLDKLEPEMVRGPTFWSDDTDLQCLAGVTAVRSEPSDGEAGRIRAFSVRRPRAFSPADMAALTDHLAATFGPALLRILGISETGDRRIIARGLGGFFLPASVRDHVDEPGVAFAVTTRDLPPDQFVDLLDAFTGLTGIDRPDRAALTDNPLAIVGFSARPARR